MARLCRKYNLAPTRRAGPVVCARGVVGPSALGTVGAALRLVKYAQPAAELCSAEFSLNSSEVRMLKLYYSPGACSMACHITLEETGIAYETQPTLIRKGEQQSEAYLKVNPRGKVPALRLEDGQVLTENTAILSYIAKNFVGAKLWPSGPVTEARAISTIAWFSNTVHPAFAHFIHPERFTADAAGADKVKEQGRKTFWGCLQEIDQMLAGKEWVLGSQFTVCDPYALVFFGWGLRAELPMKDLKNYSALKDRLLKRPAVRKVLEREQSPILKAA
jgi:glutathione S-transferase